MVLEKKINLKELASLVGGEIDAEQDCDIYGVADLDSATSQDISFLASAKKIDLLQKTQAAAVVVPPTVSGQKMPLIRVKDPYYSIAVIHNFFLDQPFDAKGIHEKALIGHNCQISELISIAPNVVVGDHVTIGKRVVIEPGVVIGDDVSIGDDCLIKANVTIAEKCKLGNRIILHSGTVIGSDGYGYATDAEGHHLKRPQVGIVQIDDDVEIGANTCVDRATFGKTWIKRGVKIDNLVQVAHNVEIGEDSLIIAQGGIAGSTTLGTGVILGGQVGVAGHITLGDRTMAGAKSGIHNDLPAKSIVSGHPAIAHKTWLRSSAVQGKLPELVKDIRHIKKKIDESS